MNYDELITAYETDVRFPEVSGMEHLDMLMTRSEIASIEPHLSSTLRQRVLQADRQLMSRARQFCEAIQAIADLSSWRRSEFTPITHWWWYLDVLTHLPVSFDAVTMRTAFQFIHDAEEDIYTLADDQINSSLS